MEVLLEEADHLFARITIRAKEGVVVSDAVKALPDLLLRQILAGVARRKHLDGTFLAFDILLDFSSTSAV